MKKKIFILQKKNLSYTLSQSKITHYCKFIKGLCNYHFIGATFLGIVSLIYKTGLRFVLVIVRIFVRRKQFSLYATESNNKIKTLYKNGTRANKIIS